MKQDDPEYNAKMRKFWQGAAQIAPGVGAAVGTGVGALLGMAGGPLAPLTVPVAAGLGGTVGGALGGGAKVAADFSAQSDLETQNAELMAKQEKLLKEQELEADRLARKQAALQLLNNFI
jgi:hypothetical protein